MPESLGPIAGSALGSLANSALGGLFGGGATGNANTIGVQNTAPLVFNAAQQAGQQQATAMENRYGTLGLGDSTMAAADVSAAKTFPFVSAATNIANLDLEAQQFNANLDLEAQKFNATAAQQYQNQLNSLTSEINQLQQQPNNSGSLNQNVGGGGGSPLAGAFTPGGSGTGSTGASDALDPTGGS